MLELFTFQTASIVPTLIDGGMHRAQWSYVTDDSWRIAYRFMHRQMSSRGIMVSDHPPVWAWYAQKTESQRLADELLSLDDWRKEWVCISLCVPERDALLSSYFHWNALIDTCMEAGQILSPQHLFDVHQVNDDDVIQATLPRIAKDWVVAIEPLTQ